MFPKFAGTWIEEGGPSTGIAVANVTNRLSCTGITVARESECGKGIVVASVATR